MQIKELAPCLAKPLLSTALLTLNLVQVQKWKHLVTIREITNETKLNAYTGTVILQEAVSSSKFLFLQLYHSVPFA